MAFDPITMGLGAGLSLLSSFGSAKSAKSQQRRQQAMDEENRRYNQYVTDLANSHNERVARELLDTPAQRSERSGVDIDRMMADADRAGFNPETWLQAGALQAYGFSDVAETNPAEAFRMMLQTPALSTASQAVKVPNALEAIGDAGTVALNMYRQDSARQDSQDFQRQMLDLQIGAYNKRGSSGSLFGSIPRMTTSGGTTSGPSFTLAGISGLGLHQPEPGKSMYTNPYDNGAIDKVPDGGVWAQRYGEPGDWLGGVVTFGKDQFLRTFGVSESDWWNSTSWNPSNPMPNYGQRHPGYDQPWLGVAH